MAEEAGFQIGKRLYPFPSSFRLGDPVLVKEVTGLDWQEFLDRIPDPDDPTQEDDMIVVLGLIAVAVWQGNPTWRRDKVSRYAQGLDLSEIEAVGGEVEEDEASPPELKAGANGSETSAASSRSEDTPSDNASQNSSGTRDSVIGSPV